LSDLRCLVLGDLGIGFGDEPIDQKKTGNKCHGWDLEEEVRICEVLIDLVLLRNDWLYIGKNGKYKCQKY
jgi:hypothetical protein